MQWRKKHVGHESQWQIIAIIWTGKVLFNFSGSDLESFMDYWKDNSNVYFITVYSELTVQDFNWSERKFTLNSAEYGTFNVVVKFEID